MTDRTHPLAGATALVCGAGGGLGSALAVELAARGAVLTLTGRDRDRLDAVPVAGERVAADLRSPAACAEVLAAAANATGGVDLVVNAAGVVAFGTAAELSPETMTTLLETNALIPMLLARASLPVMRPGGAIVTLSGVISEPGQALAGMAAYAASKAAARAFDEVLAREARRVKVRVLDARPPHTETGLASRPLEGTAPRLPEGLLPAYVAGVICNALESGVRDLPSEAFRS